MLVFARLRRRPAPMLVLLGGLVLPAAHATAAEDAALSALLKKQTQEFSDAGQTGDAATLDRYLDPDVVFTNETGEIATKKDLVDGATPPAANGVERHIEVTHWALRRQGDVATATFIDQLTQDFHGQKMVLQFQSTETWARRGNDWKMIASHTMNVQHDPAAIALPSAQLDEYAGSYRLSPTYVVKIARDGGGLSASANGAPPTPLKVEVRDVLFTPGVPNVRRIFRRDGAGHITGYVSRRDGVDVILAKVTS
jgi:ketosteroid isomerase-like protein